MKKLTCKIENVFEGFTSPNYFYAVYDGDTKVAEGVSSSESFVKYDAGGYHTKREFDEKYPEGWEVSYDF